MYLLSLLRLSLFSSTLLLAGSISQEPQNPSLIVYNSSLGLVHETRSVELDVGRQALIYPDVAPNMITDSVNVSFAEGVTLFSQQYRFDQLNTHKLAQAHLGKKVKFYIKTGEDLLYKQGTLRSATSQAVIETTDGEIYTVPTSALIFSSIPSELITKPSLVWNIEAEKKQKTTLELDYLINNISWKSNYILNIHKNSADLSGWISINNRSGKAFKNTELSLLAGDVHRVHTSSHQPQRLYKSMSMIESDKKNVQSSSQEGYHLYSVPFKVSLANNEKTQINFLEINKIPIARIYTAHLNNPFYEQGERKYPVTQSLEIKSLEKELPKGIIRAYSKDTPQTLLVGESAISHTPKHEKITITLGQNFDTKVKSTVIVNNTDRYYNDVKVKYTATNRSLMSKVLTLYIPYRKRSNGDSNIKTAQAYQWKDGNTLEFKVKISADSKKSFVVNFREKRN